MTLPPEEASEEPADPWKPLRPLIGSWAGRGDGRFGESTVKRTYEFVLDDSFVFARNASTYPPQEKNPQGERHEDWAIFSYDRARKSLVMREFHNESIVNTYVVERLDDGGRTIVLATEHIENFIPGWRARQTYRLLGRDEFEEIFEMAPPGGEFRVFITNRFKRQR